ncbi:hypothetical protein [Streptomyces cyaneofuscatus]|uniref:hypothetical protein n=1 Tax=Streptomyces cyaneofuscatus TaxID=66883 RepID=UPI00363CAE99
MADQLEKTDIQSKYAQQYADDLAANRQKQGDLTAQIAGLQENLEQLRSDEAWLTQAQGSLPGAAGSSEPTPGSTPTAPVAEAPQTVPAQRHDDQAEPKAKKTAGRGKGTSREAQKATAKRTAAKPQVDQAPAAVVDPAESPAPKTVVREKAGPALWQLALDILLKTPGQPCVAREVTEQLALEQPGRATSVQMVRNSLETLVKNGLAEKTQQHRSVMYTANAVTAAKPAGNASVGSEPEQPDETGAETRKSPARV